MVDKFEIKSHDGPGRLGKIEGNITPMLFKREDMRIAPSSSSAYNVDKEIAILNVRDTLKKAENGDYDYGVIQGSKYLDLRLKCAVELENIGYSRFLIASSDELLLRPKDMVDLIVNLRKSINPNSLLIFTFAEASFMPILSYMGIDGFLTDSTNYYSYLNDFMSPTKTYDLDIYDLFGDVTRTDLEKYNLKALEFVIHEIQAHMKNKSLRNLVEERANTNPENTSALRILDRDYKDYLLENTQLY